MPAKKIPGIISEKESCYDKLIAAVPAIERKGDTNPYTSHNGHMFTLMHKKETLAIRLPEKERDAFIKKYKAKLMEAYGTVLKEYVQVPDNMLGKTKELKPWLEASYAYIKTLKPKPTSKTKK